MDADSTGKSSRSRRADGYSIRKRPDGRWEARITIGYNEKGNPKRKSFYGRTRGEALEQAQSFKVKLDAGGFAPTTRDTSVGDWLDRWIELYVRPHREPKTTKYYEAFVRLHLKPAVGGTPLRKLTVQHLQKLLTEKAQSGLSADFIRGLRATIRAALNQAWKEGLIEQNVAAKITPPKLKKPKPQALSMKETKSFLESLADNPLGPLFAFSLATGLRLGEATGLRWSNVDIKGKVVSVSQQLQRIDGELRLKELKSSSSRRAVPLSKIAMRAIQEQKAKQLLESNANPLNLVFLNPHGRPLDPKFVDSRLKEALVGAELRPMSFHKLRHTAATLMVAAGADLHHVKQQLGHSQISLTANLYAHSVSEAQRRAAELLNDVLESGELSS